MKKYQLLRELLDFVDRFEKEQPDNEQQTLFNFMAWMNQRLVDRHRTGQQPSEPGEQRLESPDIYLGIMIGYLYRYSRIYSKKALEDTPLVTQDEFTYLATLWRHQPMTKVALIEKNIHEKTTGTEIIRRLLATGLVEQYDDQEDKRSKRLKLTQKGIQMLMTLWPVMGQVAVIMGGDLNLEEKMQLVGLLQRLHAFHNPIFLNRRDEKLTDLIQDEILKKIQ